MIGGFQEIILSAEGEQACMISLRQDSNIKQ